MLLIFYDLEISFRAKYDLIFLIFAVVIVARCTIHLLMPSQAKLVILLRKGGDGLHDK